MYNYLSMVSKDVPNRERELNSNINLGVKWLMFWLDFFNCLDKRSSSIYSKGANAAHIKFAK